MLPALKPISENSREKVVCLFSFPRTFSFIVSHPIPIPEIKKKEKPKTTLFCVLRKWFCEAVWLDNELKTQNFLDGLLGREVCAAVKPEVRPASGHLKSYSLHPESRIILWCTKPPEIICIYLFKLCKIHLKITILTILSVQFSSAKYSHVVMPPVSKILFILQN